MKSMALSLAATAALWTAVPASAQDDATTEPTPSPAAGLVHADADGDGISNHLDPDFEGGMDGDGIPNGGDADYVRPARSGMRGMPGMGMGGFVDADGDGIYDLMQDADGDGVANGKDADYVRPAGSGMHGGMGTGTRGFVDADADGVNDLAQDADGDGIPNGGDADYVRSARSGMRGGMGMGMGTGMGTRGFVDADADGVNDLSQDADGDGIPNGGDADYARPAETGRKAMGMRGAARGAGGRDTGR